MDRVVAYSGRAREFELRGSFHWLELGELRISNKTGDPGAEIGKTRVPQWFY